MSKKIKYHELKEIVLKAVKDRLKKMKNEGDTETAPVKTPPKTTPDKKPNPLKIPKPGPATRPNPKAQVDDNKVVVKGNGVNEIKKFLKENDEKIRFRRMLNEAPPMDIENPRFGDPAATFKKRNRRSRTITIL